jgi:hypothetical protein
MGTKAKKGTLEVDANNPSGEIQKENPMSAHWSEGPRICPDNISRRGFLNLHRTRLTEAAIKELRKTSLNCNIVQ